MTPNASPMGQVILGFRSLLVKIAVFVAMASMLAWILGGTLWPKTAVRIVGEPVELGGRRLVLVDQIGGPLDRATFGLGELDAEDRIVRRRPRAEEMTPAWSDALVPVAGADGVAAVAYAIAGRWTVATVAWSDEDERGWDLRESIHAVDRWDAVRRLEAFQRTGSFEPAAASAAAASAAAASAVAAD